MKAGIDAANVIVVDVWWDANEQRHSAVHLLPVSHVVVLQYLGVHREPFDVPSPQCFS